MAITDLKKYNKFSKYNKEIVVDNKEIIEQTHILEHIIEFAKLFSKHGNKNCNRNGKFFSDVDIPKLPENQAKL